MLRFDFIHDRERWHALLRTLPRPHVLQTWDWGDFKHATTGWKPQRIALYRGSTLVAAVSLGVRRMGPVCVMYAPKGPTFARPDNSKDQQDVLAALEVFAGRRGALWIKLDPDIVVGTGTPADLDLYEFLDRVESGDPMPSASDDPADAPHDDPVGMKLIQIFHVRGWQFSADQVQFRNTIVIDLTRPADDLLAAMSQTMRRKIRTAQREGVTVRPGTLDDLPALYDLYRVTGQRDRFLIRPFEYYRQAWQRFIAAGLAQPLIASYDGQPIAHVILFHFGETCWYFYGASGDAQRERQPNALLQWEAIRWAQAAGYVRYDLWGAPNHFVPDDPLWGVYQFKRGLRGVVTRHVGAWDYAPSPLLYAAYTQLMPRLRDRLRRRSGAKHTDE